MVTITAQNAAIQLVAASNVSTDWLISFDEIINPNTRSQSRDFDPPWGSFSGNITTAQTKSMLTVPDTITSYKVTGIIVRNRDASLSQTVSLAKYNAVSGVTTYFSPTVTLAAGETLQWFPDEGVKIIDANGLLKQQSATGSFRSPQLMSNPAFQTNDITSTVVVGNGQCFASYMGKAPRALDWATVRARITTAVSVGAGEWAQVAIATGNINVGAGPTLTIRGFTSIEGTWNSTGLKSTIVSTVGINEGDGLWVVAGCSGGTGAAILKVRAGLADDIQGGSFALVSSEPSTILNTATAFSILGATVSAPWFELVT